MSDLLRQILATLVVSLLNVIARRAAVHSTFSRLRFPPAQPNEAEAERGTRHLTLPSLLCLPSTAMWSVAFAALCYRSAWLSQSLMPRTSLPNTE